MSATLIRPSEFLGLGKSQGWLPLGHEPLPHQVPPLGDWDTFLLLAGRGAGKTEAGANDILKHLRSTPHARVGVGGPTIADARDVCAEGETGLITLASDEFHYNRSLGEAWHRLGGYVKFLGSEEPGRWNGPQWTRLWADELALWNEESWHQAQFGLRLGKRPQAFVTTTPKNRKFIKQLMALPTTLTVQASTFDNPYLSPNVLTRLRTRYEGTRLGRQELYAEFVDDVEGALWVRQWLDNNRVTKAPELQRVVVAVDPAATHGEEADDTGITVAGLGVDGRFYVLHGLGYQLSPHGWASKAIGLYHEHKADHIIAERNNGGEMVESTIRGIDRYVPLKTIVASRGKAVRAEPIAALYEQGKVAHVGMHAALEDQMCSFPVANEHDDMVDSLVYALAELSSGRSWRPQ